MCLNRRRLGTEKELLAVQYLIAQGYQILERNFSCKIGEIDIIASYNHAIIFVEVKYRSNQKFGRAVEAVSYTKQNTIRKVASYYLVTKLHQSNVECRFDVIGMDGEQITHIIDAF